MVIWRCTFNDFTKGGHYLLITGITEDGKVIIHDPNGENWSKPHLKDGFENGFSLRYMNSQGGQFYSFSLDEPVDIPIDQKDNASLVDEILDATGNSGDLPDLKAVTAQND